MKQETLGGLLSIICVILFVVLLFAVAGSAAENDTVVTLDDILNQLKDLEALILRYHPAVDSTSANVLETIP